MSVATVHLETIEVGENTSPLLTFQARERNIDGILRPYSLVAATVSFIAKNDRDDEDGSAAFTVAGTITDDGSGVGDEYSEFTVQLTTTHTQDSKTFFYKINVTKGGSIDTIRYGWLTVVNA